MTKKGKDYKRGKGRSGKPKTNWTNGTEIVHDIN